MYMILGAPRLDLCSLPVTIELRISVSENEIYVTIGLGIFMLENYTWPIPRTDTEWMGGYIPTDFLKNAIEFVYLVKHTQIIG